MNRSITIAGLGLIGGSLGIALRRRGWRVRFVDPNVPLEAARKHEAADQKAETLGEVDHDDLLALMTPVAPALEILSDPHSAHFDLTTGCSVMKPFSATNGTRRITAGHPFAGSHRRGLAASDGELFRARRWFIDERSSDPRVVAMIEDAGATPYPVDPEAHDTAMALTSHLPQLLSTSLAAIVERDRERLEPFFGPGLQTFLRLAGSEESVWRSTFEQNGASIAEALRMVESCASGILDDTDQDAFADAVRLWTSLSDPVNGR